MNVIRLHILVIVLWNCAFGSISAGPESYLLQRCRTGGAHQQGVMRGACLLIDTLILRRGYLSGEYHYAQGNLRGYSGSGASLYSTFEDQLWEGRIGWQLAGKNHRFIPLCGAGMLSMKNHFERPFDCCFSDKISYLLVGFMSDTQLAASLALGIHFELRFMTEGESTTSAGETLIMNEEIHAHIELPIIWSPLNVLFDLRLACVPFYEYRHLGGRRGYPLNFVDTRLHLYGARCTLTL